MPIYRGLGWKIDLPYELIGDVMRSDPVAEALKAKADELCKEAIAAYDAAGLSDAAKATIVEVGVRPRGRPFAQVTVDDSGASAYEYGDSHTDRRRILGQVGNVPVDVP